MANDNQAEKLKYFDKMTRRIPREAFEKFSTEKRKNILNAIPDLVIYDDNKNSRAEYERKVVKAMEEVIAAEMKKKRFT